MKIIVRILLVGMSQIVSMAFAGQGFYITVLNDTNQSIVVGPAGSNGFYPNDLGHDNTILPGKNGVFYTEDRAPEKDSDVLGFFVGNNTTGHYEIQPEWSIVNTATKNRTTFQSCGDQFCTTIRASTTAIKIKSIGLGSANIHTLFNPKSTPTYQVSFSESPVMCTISGGNINCNSPNVGYSIVDGQILFICQNKTSTSPHCSWITTKDQVEQNGYSIY